MGPTLLREFVCQDTKGIQHVVRVMQTLRFLGQDAAKSGKWVQSLHYIVDGKHTVEHNKAEPNLIRIPVTGTEIWVPNV